MLQSTLIFAQADNIYTFRTQLNICWLDLTSVSSRKQTAITLVINSKFG